MKLDFIISIVWKIAGLLILVAGLISGYDIMMIIAGILVFCLAELCDIKYILIKCQNYKN